MVEQLAFQLGGGGSIPTSPLQMHIKEVGVISACLLNKQWHSRLPYIDWSNVCRNREYVCYGAIYDLTWFAVAIWSDAVSANRMKDGDKILELRRMAIAPEAPKYTASWMLGKMVKDIKKRYPYLIKLISYQDTEVHNGTIYKASGWSIGNRSKGMSWTTESRVRNKEQKMAEKIRWELIKNYNK